MKKSSILYERNLGISGSNHFRGNSGTVRITDFGSDNGPRIELNYMNFTPKAMCDTIISAISADDIIRWAKSKHIKLDSKLTDEGKRNVARDLIISKFDVGTFNEPFLGFTEEQVEACINAVTKSITSNAFHHLVKELNIPETDPNYQELSIIMTENKVEDVSQIKQLIKPYVEQKVNIEHVPQSKILSNVMLERKEQTITRVNNYSNYIVNKSGHNTSLLDDALLKLKNAEMNNGGVPTK